MGIGGEESEERGTRGERREGGSNPPPPPLFWNWLGSWRLPPTGGSHVHRDGSWQPARLPRGEAMYIGTGVGSRQIPLYIATFPERDL